MARSKAKVYVCCALMLILLVAAIVCIALFVTQKCPQGSFPQAAVAADNPTCSQIGRDILQRGGSAVDGAIAALLCTSIMNPQSMGIGGGSIFTVMDSSGKVKVINSRETVPSKFQPDLLDSCPRPFRMMPGSEWIAVPGEIRGYEVAHQHYGKLEWRTLFEATIQLAREGFPLPEVQAAWIQRISNTTAGQSLRKFYSDENGNLLKKGDIIKFEKLADTLEQIANKGADAFYTGRIAEDLIRDIAEAGGTISAQDLAEYRARVTDAWEVPLGEYNMYIPPPPAGGAILSLILNIMKGYELSAASLIGEQKILTYHRFIEAFKFANGLKKHIRDPRFGGEDIARKLTEESYADYIRSLIMDNKTHEPQFYNITPHVDSIGTTHVSVLDKDGLAVSVTSTINHIFGSNVLSPRTGIILNNELSDFCDRDLDIRPGKQPPSSMAPAVLKSQRKTLVIGASGGGMITTGMTSTLMHHLWFGKSLEEAIAAKVVYVNPENVARFEQDFDQKLMAALVAMGHKHEVAKHLFNVVNAVEKENGCIFAVSDERKKGRAAGY